MDRNGKAADLLMESRLKMKRWERLPEECRPQTPAEGYAVQDLVVERLILNYGGHPVGYKIACTNKSAQELLGLDEPFYGRLLSATVYQHPAHVAADNFFMRVIEPEFGFKMKSDLPAEGAPFESEAVAAAVGAVLPAIEIVDSRYTDWTAMDGPSLIADNGCHGAWVQGESLNDWKAYDLPALEVRLIVNEEVVREGRGDMIMGHPINALTWLANRLGRLGRGLKAGDLISTGTCAEIYHAEAGETIRAEFGPVGSIELTF
jgi:2-keto-4-pentenoate hydratase